MQEDFLVIDHQLKEYSGPGGKVVIPEGVEEISPNAFRECETLTEIVFPESMRRIGMDAFRECSSLASAVLPTGIEAIDPEAFLQCPKLKTWKFSGGEGAHFRAEGPCLIRKLPDGREILFAAPGAEGTLRVPDGLAAVGDSAGAFCKNLTALILPDSITEIGNYAFSNCTALEQVEFSENLQVIGEGAFLDFAVKELHFPKRIRRIGRHACIGGKELTRVVFPEEVLETARADRLILVDWEIGRRTRLESVCIERPGREPLECRSLIDGTLSRNDSTVTQEILCRFPLFLIFAFSRTASEEAHICALFAALYQKKKEAFVPGVLEEDIQYASVRRRRFSAYAAEDGNILRFLLRENLLAPDMLPKLLEQYRNDPEMVSSLLEFQRQTALPGDTDRNMQEEMDFVLEGRLSERLAREIWQYEILPEGGVRLLRYLDTEPEVVIPAAVGEHPVTALGSGLFWENGVYCNEFVTRITVPETITVLPREVFSRCSRLTDVQLPRSLQKIGPYAFRECRALTEITIPENVTEIAERAFSSCSHLADICLPEGLRSIGDYAFSRCGLYQITLPDSLQTIGVHALEGCAQLQSAVLPPRIRKIPEMAFGRCEVLSEIVLSEHLEVIDRMAFYGCNWLETCDLPETVREIGPFAFAACLNLKTLVLPRNLVRIPTGLCYQCGGLETVTFPEALTQIDPAAFLSCTELQDVAFPASLRTIGEQGFAQCSSLTAVTFPENVTEIGTEAFTECGGLRRVEFQGAGLNIGHGSFLKCTELREAAAVPHPGEASEREFFVGEQAFEECTALETVSLPENIREIQAFAFSQCHFLRQITFPRRLREIGRRAFQRCIRLEDITLPEQVNTVGEYAFFGCSRLHRFCIPAGEAELKWKVFQDCEKLTEAVIPGVSAFGEQVFAGCPQAVLSAPAGSAAESYARENGLPFQAQ